VRITAAELRSLVSYDPETGEFIRLSTGSAISVRPDSEGYVGFSVAGQKDRAHRWAWLYMTGEWPLEDIDHIDGVRSNNAFRNLRAVSRVTNSQNQRRARSNNKTGLLGAHWHAAAGKFTAQISVRGKRTHLGLFATAEDAHAAYVEAKRRLHAGGTL